MPRSDAVHLLANNFDELPHPDGGTVRFMAYKAFGLPDEQKQRIQATAQRSAEAMIHKLESHGYTISHPDDPKPEPPVNKTVELCCADCGAALINFTADDDYNVALTSTSLAQVSEILAGHHHD